MIEVQFSKVPQVVQRSDIENREGEQGWAACQAEKGNTAEEGDSPERLFLGHVKICRVLSLFGGALSWFV